MRPLKPKGIFIFDVFTDVHNKGKTERNTWSVHENGGFWSDKPYLNLEATYLYKNGTVSAGRNVIITESEMAEYLVWDTAYNCQRLEEEVFPSGLRVKAVYDDVCGNPYTGKSETLCMMLCKEKE